MSSKEESPSVSVPAITQPIVDPVARKERLDSLLRNHVLAASGVGLVPIPLVDIIAVTGVQLDLINKLSKEFGVEFSAEPVKSIVSSLLASVAPAAIGCTVMSLLKFVPVIGQTAGAVTMPIFFGAATYALHKVFVQHYETGGTILDFDPSKVKDSFKEHFLTGKGVVADLKKNEQNAA